jgi:hypothetical protein
MKRQVSIAMLLAVVLARVITLIPSIQLQQQTIDAGAAAGAGACGRAVLQRWHEIHCPPRAEQQSSHRGQKGVHSVGQGTRDCKRGERRSLARGARDVDRDEHDAGDFATSVSSHHLRHPA